MKLLGVTIFFVLSTWTHIAFAQTQIEADESAGDQYTKVDSELNVVYKKIIKILESPESDKGFLKKFKDAEKAWIKYRDAQLLALWPYANTDSAQELYGSILPQCWSEVMTDLTRIRLEELKAWYAEFNDEIEGDVCKSEIFGPIAKKITTPSNTYNKPNRRR